MKKHKVIFRILLIVIAYAMCISGSMLPEDIKQQTDGAVLNDNSNFGATPNSDSNA